MRSKGYVVLLMIAAAAGVVVSLAAWAFLELIYQIQQELFTHLPHAVGYSHGPRNGGSLPFWGSAGREPPYAAAVAAGGADAAWRSRSHSPPARASTRCCSRGRTSSQRSSPKPGLVAVGAGAADRLQGPRLRPLPGKLPWRPDGPGAVPRSRRRHRGLPRRWLPDHARGRGRDGRDDRRHAQAAAIGGRDRDITDVAFRHRRRAADHRWSGRLIRGGAAELRLLAQGPHYRGRSRRCDNPPRCHNGPRVTRRSDR